MPFYIGIFVLITMIRKPRGAAKNPSLKVILWKLSLFFLTILMHNAEEEPRLFDAILAYADDILSAWGPFYHKILIDIDEEEHVHKFLSDFFNVQDVGKMWKKCWKT